MAKKGINAMNAAERDDYLRALEFASPSFLESILKAYRMADRGATTPSGKVLTDERGEPIRLSGGEAAAQAMGFRPERLARVSGETMPVFADAFRGSPYNPLIWLESPAPAAFVSCQLNLKGCLPPF